MPQASNKITEFPGATEEPETVASLPANFLTHDRDPTREIRNMIEELQSTVRDARRRQRQAEEEREQLRGKVLDLQEQIDSSAQNKTQVRSLVRERDMLIEQQSQYGPVISDLKQRLKAVDSEVHEAIVTRDAAVRERKQSQRLLEESEGKSAEAQRQRDVAIRQRDLSKKERDEAVKNFADAQKALAEARQNLSSSKKKGDGELPEQLASLRQARDGMATQIKDLKKRIGELEDEAAEATYAREAAEKLSQHCQAQVTDIQSVLEAAAAGNEAQKIEQLETRILELQNQLAAATEGNESLAEHETSLTAELAALREAMQASISNSTDNSSVIEEAHVSLVAAQKQIDAIIRDRDSIKEQLSANAIALEAQLNERSAEVLRLKKALSDNDGKLADKTQLEIHFEKRRLDMIDLSTRLENAHREIRDLSANLAEARLHAKLSGRPMPIPSSSASFENRPSLIHEAGPGREEITAMRRCFQSFSRDQKQFACSATWKRSHSKSPNSRC